MFLLYAQWEHFDHMAHFEEHLKFVQDVVQFLTCTAIEWSLAQICEIGSPRWQFDRFQARVFSTPCICTIKQCLHHTTWFSPFVMLWWDMHMLAEKWATWMMLSYCIWKAMSHLIVTCITHFTIGVQQSIAQVPPTLSFIAPSLPLASHLDPIPPLFPQFLIVYDPTWRK